MIDLILVSHGALAAGLREAAEMILGEQENLTVLGLIPGDSLTSFIDKVEQAVDSCSDPKNVLILSDMPNGTPHNAAMVMALKKHTACISGCNLPVLLDVLTLRDEYTIPETIDMACGTGKESIINSL